MISAQLITDVDYDHLVHLCQSNASTRVLLEIFSRRQRKSWVYTVEDLQKIFRGNSYNFSESEIRTCCKGLQEAGCGKLRRAHGTRSSQFEWSCCPIEIGKEAMKRLNSL